MLSLFLKPAFAFVHILRGLDHVCNKANGYVLHAYEVHQLFVEHILATSAVLVLFH